MISIYRLKDWYESKYQFSVDKWESAGLKHLNDSKAFTEYSNDINDIYENIKEFNTNKKRKVFLFLMMWLLIYLVIENVIQCFYFWWCDC